MVLEFKPTMCDKSYQKITKSTCWYSDDIISHQQVLTGSKQTQQSMNPMIAQVTQCVINEKDIALHRQI